MTIFFEGIRSQMTSAAAIISHLRSLRDERNIAGIVSTKKQLGIRVGSLHQIGKRNPRCAEAQRSVKIESPAARWISRDTLRELKKKARLAPGLQR